MFKHIFLLMMALLFSNLLIGQSLEKKLRKIENFEDAKNFYAENLDKYEIEHKGIKSVNELTTEELNIIEKSTKSEFKIDEIWYKILSKKFYTGSNVRYIFFDGDKINYSSLDSLRDNILKMYEPNATEENFSNYANKYTMDGNPNGGLLEWYNPESMVDIFSKSVIDHNKGDVFKIDIPERKWYYLVLKLDEETEILSLSYLRVKEK